MIGDPTWENDKLRLPLFSLHQTLTSLGIASHRGILHGWRRQLEDPVTENLPGTTLAAVGTDEETQLSPVLRGSMWHGWLDSRLLLGLPMRGEVPERISFGFLPLQATTFSGGFAV